MAAIFAVCLHSLPHHEVLTSPAYFVREDLVLTSSTVSGIFQVCAEVVASA
jgi:hypothetical protein